MATSCKFALQRGLRVIAPDLPHYGMSGPGNLDKSPARTMQDMRDVVHELVVNQLGVKQAFYLGHSLGGQVVLGYALSWPDAVQGLVLEAPAGLEEYPREFAIAPGKTAEAVRRVACAQISTNGSRPGTRPVSWRREIGAIRGGHPRLLLFQEARSGDRVRCRKPRAATS